MMMAQQQHANMLGLNKQLKKKKVTPAYAKKPPTIGHGGVIQRQSIQASSRPLTVAASKKFKRSKIAINTINHDEQYKIRNPMTQFEMLNVGPGSRSAQRKTSSVKRPLTAKPRKITYGKQLGRYNNYMSGGNLSSTPNNKNKTGKTFGGMGFKNMIMPH